MTDNLNRATLRPGLLVSLKTSIAGNVSYTKTDLGEKAVESEASVASVARWETERHIADTAEHEAAVKVRGRARTIIKSACAASVFGLLCPEDKAIKLEEALREANAIIAAFNEKAKITRISLYVIVGRVASDDAEAVRAINSEVRDLLSLMEGGIQKLDAEAVRAAATRARNVAQMLSPEAKESVRKAIDAARSIAKDIVKAGEQAAIEIDKEALAAINQARSAFLDFDPAETEDIAVQADPGHAVDFDVDQEAYGTGAAPAAAIEVEQ